MRQFFIGVLFTSIFGINGLAQDLVTKDDKSYITVTDFKDKFGYTLTHDKAQSKAAILDYYLTTRLKADEAIRLKLNRNTEFVNSMVQYEREREIFFLNEEPQNVKLRNQFTERFKNEVLIVQYFIKGITKEQANTYQNNFEKDLTFFDSMKEAKKIDHEYARVGDLPYDLEEDVYKDFKKNKVLLMQNIGNDAYMYAFVKDIRPYTGEYHFQIIALNDSTNVNSDKINEIYKKAISGEDFKVLSKQYSDDLNTKDKPFISINGNVLSPEMENILSNLQNDGISKPFKTSYGWTILKLKEHLLVPKQDEIDNAYKSSEEYQLHYNFYKVDFINDQLKPVTTEKNAIKAFKNKGLAKLMKKEELSKEEFDKQLFKYIKSKIRKENVIEFNNAIDYTNWNLLYDSRYALRKIYLGNSKQIDDELSKLVPLALFKSKVDLFDNIQDELNPKFKKEKELMEINFLTDLYDKHIYKEALKDTEGLEKKYEEIKAHYTWKERVQGIMAYCGANESIAKQIEKTLKEETTVEQLKQQYDNKDVYFKNIKVELSNKILPKTYSKNDIVKIYKEDNDYFVIKTIDILPSEIPTYTEMKNVVEEKYKNDYLKEAMQKLKKKVIINQDVLNNL